MTDTKVPFTWITSIDGLRAVAVFAVLVHHADSNAFQSWALGNVGVAVFFSISGFLAYYVLRRDESRFSRINYNYFILRRVLRIWPAYFAIIALAYFSEPNNFPGHANMSQLLTFTMNWSMAFFQPWTNLPHLWSIAVEEQFYVLAPFMYFIMRSRYRAIFLIASLVVCNGCRFAYIYFSNHPEGNGGLYYATYTYADVFLLGALVAQMFTDGWRPSSSYADSVPSSFCCHAYRGYQTVGRNRFPAI